MGNDVLLARLIRVDRKSPEVSRATLVSSSLSFCSSVGAAHGEITPQVAFSEDPDDTATVCAFPITQSEYLVRVTDADGQVSSLKLQWPTTKDTHPVSLCVSVSPLAVYVTARDNYVYRVNLQRLLHRHNLPHIVSSAARRTLDIPTLTQSALQASDKLTAERVLKRTDRSTLVPTFGDQGPLCTVCTRSGSVVACGLDGGYVHIADLENSRSRTVPCGARDIVRLDVLGTTVSTNDLGSLDVEFLVATCELGTVYMHPLRVSEGGVDWWIFDAGHEISWFVPDIQSGYQKNPIVQIVHDLGKVITHASTLPGTEPTQAGEGERDQLGQQASPLPLFGSAGWLLVVHQHSGKGALFSLRQCMDHWLSDIIDVQRFSLRHSRSEVASASTSQAFNDVQFVAHSWDAVAELDIKSALNLPRTAEIISVTEYDKTLCVSCINRVDSEVVIAELIVANVVADPETGACTWNVSQRIAFDRSDVPQSAVKVRGRWTPAAGGSNGNGLSSSTREGIIIFCSQSVLYLSKCPDDQQSRWAREDPIKLAAMGRLDDAINLAVTQLHRSDHFQGRDDLLLHTATWIIQLAKREAHLDMTTLLREILTEMDPDDFCALMPSLIGAGAMGDAISVAIERRCVPDLLGIISSEAVTTLNLSQTNELILAGYANELALHADGLLFKRLGTSAQLCILFSSRATFNHCYQRVLDMLPNLNLDLLQCVIWVLTNWAAPSTSSQWRLEAKRPATIDTLGVLGYVRQSWDHKRMLASVFQTDIDDDLAASEPLGWTTCELEVTITCWLAFLMQKCVSVKDYKALIQGGISVRLADTKPSARPVSLEEMSELAMRILDDDAPVEELQVVLMRLLVSALPRCNAFVLLGRCIDLHNFPAAALVLELSGRNAAALSMHLRVAHLMACFGSSIDDNAPSPMVSKKRNFWHRVDEVVDEAEWLATGRGGGVQFHPPSLEPDLQERLAEYLMVLMQQLIFAMHEFSSHATPAITTTTTTSSSTNHTTMSTRANDASSVRTEADQMLAQVLCLWSALRLPVASLDCFLREALTKKQPGVDIAGLLHATFLGPVMSAQAEVIRTIPLPPDFLLDVVSAVVSKHTRQ